jgi:hypothetical protein
VGEVLAEEDFDGDVVKGKEVVARDQLVAAYPLEVDDHENLGGLVAGVRFVAVHEWGGLADAVFESQEVAAAHYVLLAVEVGHSAACQVASADQDDLFPSEVVDQALDHVPSCFPFPSLVLFHP